MKAYDLSLLIPARNEEWLSRTVQDILEHKSDVTEIIVGLDGQWASPGIPDHPDVRIVYYPQSLGQRGMSNQLCRLSSAKYIAKTDAHVSFDDGFDVKMLDAFKEVGDNIVMAPTMRNMHIFDWVCKKCKNRWYQGPTPTFCYSDNRGKVKNEICDSKDFERDVKWIAKRSPQSTSYRFDKTMHFQYFGEYKKRQEGELVETLSLQGSFFMCTREKYWELNLGDETFGGWGSQGSQVACSFWLSGGRVLVNKRTWYAHLFRTQGGDFGFPYPLSGREVEKSRHRVRELFLDGKWDKAIHPLSWLIEKFKPVPGWHDDLVDKPSNDMEIQEDFPKAENGPRKGIIFYTDNQLNLKIAHAVQDRLKKISKEKNIPIVSCSLKPMNNFGKNIHLPLERGTITYFKQIIAALEASDADIVYMAEHDCLYSSEHFDFTPPDRTKFYYDHSVWKVRSRDGFAVSWDANQVAQLVADRKLLLDFYKERIKEVEKDFNRSYEPGGRDSNKYESWKSSVPSIDIRHESNLTKSKWSTNDFRDKSTCVNWQESDIDNIPGWSGEELRKILGL